MRIMIETKKQNCHYSQIIIHDYVYRYPEKISHKMLLIIILIENSGYIFNILKSQ